MSTLDFNPIFGITRWFCETCPDSTLSGVRSPGCSPPCSGGLSGGCWGGCSTGCSGGCSTGRVPQTAVRWPPSAGLFRVLGFGCCSNFGFRTWVFAASTLGLCSNFGLRALSICLGWLRALRSSFSVRRSAFPRALYPLRVPRGAISGEGLVCLRSCSRPWVELDRLRSAVCVPVHPYRPMRGSKRAKEWGSESGWGRGPALH